MGPFEIGRPVLRKESTRRNAMKTIALVAFTLALQFGFLLQLATL